MVVDGALGVLFRHAISWSRVIDLQNDHVIIDMTHSLYWFTRRLLLTSNRMDLYGCSMIEYGAFFRNLIQRLLERNVTPIIVYEGCRLNEIQHGDLVSKNQIMAESCQHAMANLNQCREQNRSRFQNYLPELAANVLKEIVNEFQLEFVIQARHEVYPVLEHLARERHCPVMTSHGDFIFYDVPAGFIWFNVIQVPTNIRDPFSCRIFEHYKMMDYYNMLLPNDCLALRTLFVLMRTDFRAKYYKQINRLLRLRGDMALSEQIQDRKLTKRLEHILEYWTDNRDLMTQGTIRAALIDQNPDDGELIRDFDMIYESFTIYEGNFQASDEARLYEGCDLAEALTDREATAELLLNLHSTQNNRPGIEDTSIYRSTFSLHDNCRQHLLAALNLGGVRVFDRTHDELRHRQLLARGGGEPLDRESLFQLFHFDSVRHRKLTRELIALGLDPTNSSQLALVLLLAHFGYKLMDRQNHDNELEASEQAMSGREQEMMDSDGTTMVMTNEDSGLGSELRTRDNSPRESRRSLAHENERRRLFTALVNSHIYHARKLRNNKSSRLADIRVARDKLQQVARLPAKIQPINARSRDEYFRLKHMIEMLNSVLRGYIELNSLYDYPGPRLYVCKYYDGVLIYKIMARWSANLQGYLIRLEGEQLDELISGAELRDTQSATR